MMTPWVRMPRLLSLRQALTMSYLPRLLTIQEKKEEADYIEIIKKLYHPIKDRINETTGKNKPTEPEPEPIEQPKPEPSSTPVSPEVTTEIPTVPPTETQTEVPTFVQRLKERMRVFAESLLAAEDE